MKKQSDSAKVCRYKSHERGLLTAKTRNIEWK